MRTAIAGILARRVWDSRGRPTVEVEVRLDGGARGRAIAPAGASRGSNEAIDLRDGGDAFGGFGVTRAIEGIHREIFPSLRGSDSADQAAIDAALIALDGTRNKGRLGGNALIAVSMAVLRAAAASEGVPLWRYLAQGRPVRLPLPEIQIFGGGAHAARRIDIQDLMVMPVGASSFDEALAMCAEVYRAAGNLMDQVGRRCGVADEGGWWPDFSSNELALEMLVRSIEAAGYRPGEQMAISLDIAASEFASDGRYRLGLDRRELDTGQWIETLLDWTRRFPIASVEDPVAEDDAEGMRVFTRAAGERIQVIGDDYLVTDAAKVAAAARTQDCNAVLIKPNQAGTVSETLRALEAGKSARWGTVVSARSGETEDDTIVHMAIGWDAGQIKVGSMARSERTVKWNEGLRIEAELGTEARFAGRAALPTGDPPA